MHEQSRQIVWQDVEKLLRGILLSLSELGELFVSFFFTHELRRHRVRENEHPGWQKQLTTWYEQKQRERNELDEVLPHLLHPLFLDVCRCSVGGLLFIVFVLDDPLAIIGQSLESMNHMRNSMLNSLPDDPRFAQEPVHEIYDSVYLSFCKACNFEHHGIDVASEGQI